MKWITVWKLQKRLPSREIELETKDGTFYFFKADILSNQITYSTDKNIPANLVTISGKRVFEIIGMNKRYLSESLVEEARDGTQEADRFVGTGKLNPLRP